MVSVYQSLSCSLVVVESFFHHVVSLVACCLVIIGGVDKWILRYAGVFFHNEVVETAGVVVHRRVEDATDCFRRCRKVVQASEVDSRGRGIVHVGAHSD